MIGFGDYGCGCTVSFAGFLFDCILQELSLNELDMLSDRPTSVPSHILLYIVVTKKALRKQYISQPVQGVCQDMESCCHGYRSQGNIERSGDRGPAPPVANPLRKL